MTDLINLDTLVLEKGAHDTLEDGVCIMEAVAWWAGEPHSDRPACVSTVICTFLRRWNDDLDDDTRQKLKWFIPLLPGTAADAKTEERRAWRITDWMVRTYLPAWLRLAGMSDQAEAVAQLPAYVDAETVKASLKMLTAAEAASTRTMKDVASRATWDAAEAAVWNAADGAARVAASVPVENVAGNAARIAAIDVARIAADGAARVAAGGATRAALAAARDALRPTVESLQESALQLVDELIAMKAVSVS